MQSNLACSDFQEWEEIIDGEIVAMSPRSLISHNRVSFNIARIFGNYLKDKKCVPFGDGTDLYLSEEERYIPDSMIVCDESKIQRRGVYGAPDLVVEVLSSSTEKHDRGKTKDAYERFGVKEYWIVSPYSGYRAVEVYLLKDGKFVLDNVYRYYLDYELADMTEEERAEVVTDFQCSLFDDLTIPLSDVFYRLD